MSTRSIRLFSAATAALLLTACSASEESPTGVEASQAIAGLNEAAPVAGTKIPNRYIVVFKDEVGNPASEAAAMMRGRGGQIHFTYTHAIKGFAATMPAAAVEAISRNPKVAYVEQDAVVVASVTQTPATWGIDRIDQRALPLSGGYTYQTTGAGASASVGRVTSAGTGSPNRLLYTGTEAAPPPVTYSAPTNLSLPKAKVRNGTRVTASWISGGASSFDVFSRTSPTGAWILSGTTSLNTLSQNWRGTRTFYYRVCEAGTNTCSAEASITI